MNRGSAKKQKMEVQNTAEVSYKQVAMEILSCLVVTQFRDMYSVKKYYVTAPSLEPSLSLFLSVKDC